MRTFVKFCGLRDASHLALVPAEGAAGLVIDVPASPRTLTVEQAGELSARASSEIEVWAVTVDPSLELVRRIFDEAGVDRIQIHGRIPEGLDSLERHHLVPSVPVPPEGEGGSAPPVPADDEFRRIHIDVAGGPAPGGTGRVPDWAACARIVDELPGRRVLLGGGLTPENVEAALAAVRPWGVDVSSGIESSPGHKDPARMRAFLDAIARAEAGHA